MNHNSANEKIKWGIIGTGSIAAKFAIGLQTAENAELAAVGSRSLKKATAFADRFAAAKALGSYQELVADTDIDVVYIATPHSFHADNTILAVNAGRAVLCEKPFAINADQAGRMIDAAKNANVFLMEAMWTRFLPAMVQVRAWLAEGIIGDVRMLYADFGFAGSADPQGRALNPALGGGALLDVGIYPVSLASMVFGAVPDDITGLAHIGSTGVDEQSAFIFRYGQGRLAVLSCAVMTQTPGDAVIMGTKGRMKIHSPFWRSQAVTIIQNDGSRRTLELPYIGNGYNYQAAEVAKCIRAGQRQSDIMPLDETLRIMRTMDKIRRQWGLKYPCEYTL